ncbi:hypothetical protein QBC32DRAFT_380817 [Pseudoneurospora amorphoporcata]|uniref:Uncharacterized protein n=1 Tax=Pseudoneurospora amorphoporcata TaxID=241081 RepID=A0AAN6SD45_9PEZI|nr:hypothetical protein QBC32DRAFT_380817 [Pseudoneurospora amorphoporcata]
MRTSRIATALLALAPTAIFGSPVSILKDGIIAIDHSLAGSKTTIHDHGLANRDTPPDLDSGWICGYNSGKQFECIGGPYHLICIYDRDGIPISCTDQQKIAAPVSFAKNLNAKKIRDDTISTDPNYPWVCGYNAGGQYECIGGPYHETCIYDKQMNRTCTKNNNVKVDLEATVIDAAAAAKAQVKARDGGDGWSVWDCSNTSLRQYQCTGGPNNETCIFDDGRQVSCTPAASIPGLFKTSGNSDSNSDGDDPDFSCATDVTSGDYVCTGADVRCVIGKQGDATCSFNGPDGGSGSDGGGDASKYRVNEERLAMVLSTVGPSPKSKGTEDDSDPFDINPNYSCSQIADYVWSCGSNGIPPPPGSGNGKGKSLDARGSGDPGQGCNQPQGFFGGCDGRLGKDAI